MFCDIKNEVNSDTVKRIFSACLFDNSDAAVQKKLDKYMVCSKLHFYGWIDDGNILGVVGFKTHEGHVEILHIAVDEGVRHKGIGRNIICKLQQTYGLPIEAETDDDAIDFYRKCGFKYTTFTKHGVTRYACVLKAALTLLYGTGNRAKLNTMQKRVKNLPINIIGLNDIYVDLPEIDESGSNPLENARIKAHAYYNATGMPVFSCDSGLYIKDAPDEMQPGVHVRNVAGKHLNDEEMIEHYARLAERLGGNITVQYKNAICLVMDDDHVYEYMEDDIVGEAFILTSVPHPKRVDGFPLDSLSVHIETGKYYYDMEDVRGQSSVDAGFCTFFRQILEKGIDI